MKKIVILVPICFLLLCLSCTNKNKAIDEPDDEIQSLEGTIWKLEGIVDKTGALEELKPDSCLDCYTLLFFTDALAEVFIEGKFSRERFEFDFSKLPTDEIVFTNIGRPEVGERFFHSFYRRRAYSATSNELKVFCVNEYDYHFLFKRHLASTPLKGTKWKLTGIVNTQTGDLKELEPQQCDECYTLNFYTDYTAIVRSVDSTSSVLNTPGQGYGLFRLYLLQYLPDNNTKPDYDILVDFEELYENGLRYSDGALFRNALFRSESYSATSDELKIFFQRPACKSCDKTLYYLLFKTIKI